MDLSSFRAVVGQAPDAIIFSDPEGIIRVWNEMATKVFGFSDVEALGSNLDLIIPKDLREAHWRGFHKAMALGRTASEMRHLTTPALHKSGGKLYVELGFSIIANEFACVIGSMAVARDITQRHLAVEAVLQEELALHSNRSTWSWA